MRLCFNTRCECMPTHNKIAVVLYARRLTLRLAIESYNG
jgi:hypothetical protein